MPIGIAEVLLIAVLAFVAFGPRRRTTARGSIVTTLARIVAVVAPSLVLMGRAGAAFGLGGRTRLLLAASSVAATLLTVGLLHALGHLRPPDANR